MLCCNCTLFVSSPLLLSGYQLFHYGGPLFLPRVTVHSVGQLGRGCTLTRSCNRINLTPQQVRAAYWPRLQSLLLYVHVIMHVVYVCVLYELAG
jgi:hypothetical protein